MSESPVCEWLTYARHYWSEVNRPAAAIRRSLWWSWRRGIHCLIAEVWVQTIDMANCAVELQVDIGSVWCSSLGVIDFTRFAAVRAIHMYVSRSQCASDLAFHWQVRRSSGISVTDCSVIPIDNFEAFFFRYSQCHKPQNLICDTN